MQLLMSVLRKAVMKKTVMNMMMPFTKMRIVMAAAEEDLPEYRYSQSINNSLSFMSTMMVMEMIIIMTIIMRLMIWIAIE